MCKSGETRRRLICFGLLVNTLIFNFGSIAVSAAGLKNYDLYSWKKGREWGYTIIAQKDQTNDAVEIRWSPGRVKGLAQLKEEILHLPEGAVLQWRQMEEHGLIYPPNQVVDEVKNYAASVGVRVTLAPDTQIPKPYEGGK